MAWLFEKQVRWSKRWFIKHTLIFIIGGAIGLAVLYYNILQARQVLAGGYFSSSFLNTMTELTWFLMGGLLLLSAKGVVALFKKKKKRGKR